MNDIIYKILISICGICLSIVAVLLIVCCIAYVIDTFKNRGETMKKETKLYEKETNGQGNTIKINDDKFIPQGWECPKCGAVMSPWTSVCVNCNGQTQVSIGTTTKIPYLKDEVE